MLIFVSFVCSVFRFEFCLNTKHLSEPIWIQGRNSAADNSPFVASLDIYLRMMGRQLRQLIA
jgi:hypothetical protein